MTIPTFFKQVKESVNDRKKNKALWDSTLDLSNKEKKAETLSTSAPDVHKVRLLNEGAITYSDGSMRLYLCKGTLKEFYDNLDDDYVGYINLGHMDMGSLPLVFGTWTKADLSLVDIGNGRYALDCTPHYNEDLSIVRDILSQDIPLSVSVEFYGNLDEELSCKLGTRIYQNVFIAGFSVVGDPANVDSYDVLSSEGKDMEELLKKLGELLKSEQEPDEELSEAAETAPEAVETAADSEEAENEQKPEEEEKPQETAANEPESEEQTELAAQVEELTAKYEALQKENAELKAKLADKEKSEEALNNRISDTLKNLESKLNKASAEEKKNPIWG